MKKIFKVLILCVMTMLMCLSMVGCISSNWSKVNTKLTKEGYETEMVLDKDDIEDYLDEFYVKSVSSLEIDCFIIAGSYSDYSMVAIAFCNNKSAAKRLEEHLELYQGKLIDAFDMKGDVKFGRDGKVVYFGNKEAVKAAR